MNNRLHMENMWISWNHMKKELADITCSQITWKKKNLLMQPVHKSHPKRCPSLDRSHEKANHKRPSRGCKAWTQCTNPPIRRNQRTHVIPKRPNTKLHNGTKSLPKTRHRFHLQRQLKAAATNCTSGTTTSLQYLTSIAHGLMNSWGTVKFHQRGGRRK
jgi:hypothetical protein